MRLDLPHHPGFFSAMPSNPDREAQKQARLAQALRENLRRRKAQARAREEAAPAKNPTAANPEPPHPEKTPDKA